MQYPLQGNSDTYEVIMSLENILTISMWVLFGCSCAYFAKKQKRNRYVWFFVGLLLGIFGLLLLLMLPMLERFFKKEEKKQPSTVVIDMPIEEKKGPSLSTDPAFADILWYYLDENKAQVGPMSLQALERNWAEGKLQAATYVWNEKLSDWKTIGELFSIEKNATPQ